MTTWNRRWLLLAGVSAVVFVASVWSLTHRSASGSARSPIPGFGEIAVRVEPGDGRDSLVWCLLAALDSMQRNRGLMEVTDLRGYPGMAFVYQEDVDNAFYMRNTPTPLTIAWISAAGRVVTINDMAPCADREGCPLYEPDGPYRVAIEVPTGTLADLGITPAATVEVGGSCAAG